jgi:hypothetical protein
MKIRLFPIFIAFIFMSCSKEYYFKRDINEIAFKLYELKQLDQSVRNQEGYFNYYYGVSKFDFVLDSLTWTGNKKKIDSFISNTHLIQTSKKKLSGKKQEDYIALKKRTQVVTKFVDSLASKELIKITNKYGFPSHNRLITELGIEVNKKLTSSPHIIFVHSPEKYYSEIRELVIREYKKGRMTKNVCSHIFWHLNGREGYPFPNDYSHCKVDTLR